MNRDKSRLLLSEYGRNVQTMVSYLKTIEDRELRNRQAEVVVAVMGNVNPAQKDSEGFQHMLWDHLFMIADFDLDVDAPYPTPTPDMFAPHPHPGYGGGQCGEVHEAEVVRIQQGVPVERGGDR